MPVPAGHFLGGNERVDDSFLGGLHDRLVVRIQRAPRDEPEQVVRARLWWIRVSAGPGPAAATMSSTIAAG